MNEQEKELAVKIFDYFFNRFNFDVSRFMIFKRTNAAFFGLNIFVKYCFNKNKVKYPDCPDFALYFTEHELADFKFFPKMSRLFTEKTAIVSKDKIDLVKAAVIDTCIKSRKPIYILLHQKEFMIKMLQILPAVKSLEELAIKMELES